MQEPAATLDETKHYLSDPIQQPGARQGGAMKFAYASGSRPLPNFTIKRGIGVGGFGEVYFATSDAGKEVALKRIQRNLDVEVRGVTQCLNLRHANLIDLYDIKYDDAGQAWVVMEYVSGECLRDVLDRYPNGLPADEVVQWFEQIAAGVSYLHDNGIVHRDLKPGNIFTEDNEVKIGDYGLSKFISCSRRSGQTESVGTFHYMAPEIGKGVYGKEIDIYALGVILYEMATGHVPFDGESSQEIIMKHLTADPELSTVPTAFREVVRRALLKDPDQRFSSVQEMRDAVKRGLAAPQEPPRVQHPQSVAAASPAKPSEPLYIGDEDDEIQMGPLKQHAAAKQENLRGQRTRPGVVRTKSPVHIEEPIAAAAYQTGRGALDWWRHRLSTPLQVLFLLGAVVLLIVGAPWWIPVAVVLGLGYLMYYAIRSLTTGWQAARLRTAGFERQIRAARKSRPTGDKAAEWLGALLFSALICAICCAVMMAAADRSLATSIDNAAFFAWLSITATAATWTLISLGRFWERKEQTSGWRTRAAALLASIGVAVGAFGLQGVMLSEVDNTFVSTAGNMNLGAFDSGHVPLWVIQDGQPQLPAFLLFFAGLFAIIGWSKRVDPLRRARFSFWATALCVLCGWMLMFPQPWGLMLAAATSVAVQLSSPWVSPRARAA